MQSDFFVLHHEMKLGLRKLTDSDLGLADNATTHIGLYAGVLTFLKDEAVQHSYVIYNKSYYEMTSWFDRIIRGGEPSTPKIRTGKSEISVVSLIRNIAGENKGKSFYLMWFGLENEDIVYFLLEEKSEIFRDFFEEGINLHKVYDLAEPANKQLLDKIQEYFNIITEDLQTDIQEAVETGIKKRSFNIYDLDKAEKIKKDLGLSGERTINTYLEELLQRKEIYSFEWMNKQQESGLPYDFIIYKDQTKLQYVDVKKTKLDFLTSVYFSSNEIQFVSEKNNEDYSIYRIYYDDTEEKYYFKECSHCKEYMEKLKTVIEQFSEEVDKISDGAEIKIKVSPSEKYFKKITDKIRIELVTKSE